MHQHPAERRRFTRIHFDAQTKISQGPLHWSVKLLDVSLKGLLVEKPQSGCLAPGQTFTANIHLSDETHVIMEVRLAHEDAQHLGFECTHIGLDSISHLRRLVELNMGDEQLLERELGALISTQ